MSTKTEDIERKKKRKKEESLSKEDNHKDEQNQKSSKENTGKSNTKKTHKTKSTSSKKNPLENEVITKGTDKTKLPKDSITKKNELNSLTGSKNDDTKKSEKKITFLIFFAIVNNDLINKSKLFFFSTNNFVQYNLIREVILPFENIQTKNYYVFNKTIKRSFIIYEIKLLDLIRSVKICFEYENKKYFNNRITYLYNVRNLKNLEMQLFINDDLKKNNNIFSVDEQKEKSLIFDYIVKYFKDKEPIWRTIFLDKYFEKDLFNQMKDMKTVYTLADMLDNRLFYY